MRVHVGGGDPERGTATGIHWHMNIANQIEYVATDDGRQTIPYVWMKDQRGVVHEYVGEGADKSLEGRPRRRMDCTDCHNRPSHVIAATPERAVDEAMAAGEIPRRLPFVRREAVKALKASYTSQESAAVGISRSLGDFYRTAAGASAADLAPEAAQAAEAVAAIYRRSVFPEMKVGFGTYPNNIGHVDAPGCFRCHDDSHKSNDGRKIGQDCETCHAIE
jgi:hypothetical protein